MADDRKKITVFLDCDLHERMVLAGLRRHKKLQGAMVEAAEDWLVRPASGVQPATETTERKIAAKDRYWHDLLNQILEGGTEADINGIQRNLEWGAAAVVHRGKKRRTGS